MFCISVDSSESNLVALCNIEGAWFFKITADIIGLNLELFLMYDSRDATTDIKCKYVNVEFRGDDNESHSSAFFILYFDHLHDILGYGIDRLTSST